MTTIPTTPQFKHAWEKEYWSECTALMERFRRRLKTGNPMDFEHFRQELGHITMNFHTKYTLFKMQREWWSGAGRPDKIKGESGDDYEARCRKYERSVNLVSEHNKELPDRIAYWQGLAAAYDERMEREGMGG